MTALGQRRCARRLQEAAAALAQGEPTGPDERCAICRRNLTDHASVERGIGPKCWHLVVGEARQSTWCHAANTVGPQGELRL